MQDDLVLSEAMAIYFEAKAVIFRDVADFHLCNVGPLKCFHKHPGWSEIDAFYAYDVSPAEAVAAVRDYRPHPRHMLQVFTLTPEALIDQYGELGYKPMRGTQPFMRKRLAGMMPAEELRTPISSRRTPPMAEYWAEDGGRAVGWGKSVTTSRQAIYVYGMETRPDFRRCGLATAVLSRIHADASAAGAAWSILCSSAMGLPLYQKAGYAVLAQMQGFVPQD